MGIYLTPPKNSEYKSESKDAYLVAQKLGSRYLEGEDLIAKDAFYSVEYAKIVGRFEKGEPEIAKVAKLSLYYAMKILKDRFVPGEHSIAQSAYYSCAYSLYILKGKKIDVIHHSMLSKGITEENQYWVKEYCRYMRHLEEGTECPYWADENAAINWF